MHRNFEHLLVYSFTCLLVYSFTKNMIDPIKNIRDEEALVVFSGGQDSTTCLFWAKRHFARVTALSFVYGQKHALEVELAEKIAMKAGVRFERMDIPFIAKLSHHSLTDPSIVMDLSLLHL